MLSEGPVKMGGGPPYENPVCAPATDRRRLLGVYVLVRWETPVLGYFGRCSKFAVCEGPVCLRHRS